MTDQPLVSICMANRNYGRFLGAALDRALDQTYTHVEIVVVDDGSTDDSPAVLKRYAGRVKYELSEPRGQGGACNRSFELSNGEIVLFHDSDDMLEPDAIERIVEAFEPPDVAVVLGRLRDVDEKGDPLPGLRPFEGCRLSGGDLRRMVADRANFIWPETTGQSYRRSALESILPIPDQFAPDLYLSHLAALDGRVAVIERPVGLYRVHGSNKSAKPSRVGVAWLDNKIHERRMVDHQVREVAYRKGVIDAPPKVGDDDDPAALPHDYIRAGLEVARRRLTREPGAVKWSIEGIRSIATHPQFKLRSRAKHIAWFASAAIAPPSVARRLVFSRYPHTRAVDPTPVAS
jgi:hypothetical protein